MALALVPEAVAFALAAGLPPDVGLNSAWIISVPRKGGCRMMGGVWAGYRTRKSNLLI